MDVWVFGLCKHFYMPIPVYVGIGYRANARAFFGDTLRFVLDRQRELGHLYRIKLPWRRLYISSDPQVFREVLVNQQKAFRKSAAYREMAIALGNGLLTSEGDFWLRQRRLIQPAFHRTALEKLYRIMQSETERHLELLATRVAHDPVIDISLWMSSVTADIALKTLFSSEGRLNNEEVSRQITETQSYVLWRIARPWMKPLFPFLPRHRRFKRIMASFDANVHDIIRERRQSGTLHHDLLDLLLHARDEDTGASMSDNQLRDEIMTLYVAGHETSANALAWAAQCLMDHPEAMARAVGEADVSFEGASPGWDAWQRLVYHQQVSDEVLRMYPPAHSIGREVAGEVSLYGEKIPRRSIVLLSIYALHRHADLWPDPHRFDPSRFDPDRVAARDKFAWLPFGAGPRLCIGARFASMEIPLILAALLKRFSLQPIAHPTPRPTGLLTLKPIPAVMARLKER
jgi:cytochrome P450